jgi:hypothetical protein
MQEYPVKRTHIKILSENIVNKLREHFEIEPKESNGFYELSFGAIELMQVKIGSAGKSVIIGTKSLAGIEDETVILDTNRRFRRYLDDVTGYTTKDRVKKAKTVE